MLNGIVSSIGNYFSLYATFEGRQGSTLRERTNDIAQPSLESRPSTDTIRPFTWNASSYALGWGFSSTLKWGAVAAIVCSVYAVPALGLPIAVLGGLGVVTGMLGDEGGKDPYPPMGPRGQNNMRPSPTYDG